VRWLRHHPRDDVSLFLNDYNRSHPHTDLAAVLWKRNENGLYSAAIVPGWLHEFTSKLPGVEMLNDPVVFGQLSQIALVNDSRFTTELQLMHVAHKWMEYCVNPSRASPGYEFCAPGPRATTQPGYRSRRGDQGNLPRVGLRVIP
jgi:hypothetical protein